jgi:hypothetical protein
VALRDQNDYVGEVVEAGPANPHPPHPVLQFPSTYPSLTPPLPLLLYSQHGRFRAMRQAGWLLPHDYRFVASIVPHSPTPLHWHVVRSDRPRSAAPHTLPASRQLELTHGLATGVYLLEVRQGDVTTTRRLLKQ